MNFRRVGGVAALILAAAYVAGIAVNFTLLDTSGIGDAAGRAAFLAARLPLFHAVTFFVYVVFAVALVFLALALDAEVRGGAAELSRAGLAFALIWAGLLIGAGNVAIAGLNSVAGLVATDPAQAGTVWEAVNAVHLGLSGTSELPGALWTLLVSAAALRGAALGAAVFPRGLSYLGLAVAAAGLLTIVPPLFMPAVLAYALGHCAWWVWMGALLLRRGAKVTVAAGRVAAA